MEKNDNKIFQDVENLSDFINQNKFCVLVDSAKVLLFQASIFLSVYSAPHENKLDYI